MIIAICLLQCAFSRAASSSGGFIYPGNQGPDLSIPCKSPITRNTLMRHYKDNLLILVTVG